MPLDSYGAGDAEDEEDGRTVVRGAPKIVKRTAAKGHTTPGAALSPAAVIKATLESGRFAQSAGQSARQSQSAPLGRRQELLPGPPAELLEDRSDFERPSHGGYGAYEGGYEPSSPSARYMMEGPPSRPPSSYAPPPSHPASGPPSSRRNAGLAPVLSSVPGLAASSMPAHFMTPLPPSSSDPPATSITSSHRVPGRPAVSWAAALLACGLFVGVAAVAVLQSSEAVAETTAATGS
jgi:hypothetical protein